MKNTFYMMLGAAAGIGLYIGACNMSTSMNKNKKKIKAKVNSLIDDTADMFN